MTTQHSQHWPYFVISIVRTDTPDKLRKLYKRFVTKYSDELQKADLEHKMFRGTDFKELKGAMFSPPLKRAFAETFCDDSLLELYYIMLDNKRISEKLYENNYEQQFQLLKEKGCLKMVFRFPL